MKYLAILLFALTFISCNFNKNEKIKTLNKTLGEELINANFLVYADSLKADLLKNNIIESFYIYDEDNYKIALIDAEELSEFNFDFFIPRLNKILQKRGLKLNVKTTVDYKSTNKIIINGEPIILYTNSELNSETFWNSAPRNFFKKVNRLLKEKNNKEQFYLLYSGNDLHVLLLTEKQFKIIAERYKKEKNEIPYMP